LKFDRVYLQKILKIFLTYKTWGILIFRIAFSIGNLLYIPGGVLLEGDFFAVGKEWGGLVTYIGVMMSSLISFEIN
jgi:uncharacterized membrane protein YdjX (TVP38/TMEM64 family)